MMDQNWINAHKWYKLGEVMREDARRGVHLAGNCLLPPIAKTNGLARFFVSFRFVYFLTFDVSCYFNYLNL